MIILTSSSNEVPSILSLSISSLYLSLLGWRGCSWGSAISTLLFLCQGIGRPPMVDMVGGGGRGEVGEGRGLRLGVGGQGGGLRWVV